MRRSGLALILVVAVLGILGVLGSAFAVLSRLERKTARQRIHATQATLLARSGIEDAMARLDGGQDALYAGEDFNADNAPNGIETGSNQVYRPTTLDVESCPAAHALRPSFFKRDPGNPALPLTVAVDTRQRGYSGQLGSGDYALKVLTGGGFYVNGGDPGFLSNPTAVSDYNTNLRRMLGILAEAIDREDGADDGLPVDQADGWNLVALRPQNARGWETYAQVRDLALGGIQAKLDALQPYLALKAWVDKKVIAPSPPKVLNNLPSGTWVPILKGTLANPRTPPEFEKVNGKLVGRAPVDLAWARRRKPALIALFGDLQGRVAVVGTESSWFSGNVLLDLDWSQPTDDCRRVADVLFNSTADLRTWAQWESFCSNLMLTSWITDALMPGARAQLETALETSVQSGAPVPDWQDFITAWWELQGGWDYGTYAPMGGFRPSVNPAPGLRDLLKANFNPNSDLMKLNPDRSLAKSLDKSDLLAYSTEFSLRSLGGERITAVGRVRDAAGRLLASRTLSMERPLQKPLRLTTQGEFVGESLGNLEEAGDESAWRSYGDATDTTGIPYITRSKGAGPTFGQEMDPDTGQGFTLQTYPEPHLVWALPGGSPSAIDGQIRLATVDTAFDPSTLGLPGAARRFQARWTQGYAGVSGACLGSPTLVSDVSTPPPGNSVWNAASPGMLRPDGLYIEEGRQPSYEALGNFPPRRGAISFWLKPSYFIEHDSTSTVNGPNDGVRVLFNNHRWNAAAGIPKQTAIFALSTPTLENCDNRSGMIRVMNYFFQYEKAFGGAVSDTQEMGGNSPEATSTAFLHGASLFASAHCWKLLTAVWDMEKTTQTEAIRLLLNQGNEPISWSYRNPVYAGPLVDFTAPNPGEAVPGLFCLGSLRGDSPTTNNNFYGPAFTRAPDATLDELDILDLGTGPLPSLPGAAATLAQARWKEGRYYKPSGYPPASAANPLAPFLAGFRTAGEWFSAPIPLPPGSRILGLSWTQVVPEELRLPGDASPGRIRFDLSNPAGDDLARDVRGARIAKPPLKDPAFSPVERTVGASFRLHAIFEPNLADALNTPILDALALDDVTVFYHPPGVSPCGAWTEGE